MNQAAGPLTQSFPYYWDNQLLQWFETDRSAQQYLAARSISYISATPGTSSQDAIWTTGNPTQRDRSTSKADIYHIDPWHEGQYRADKRESAYFLLRFWTVIFLDCKREPSDYHERCGRYGYKGSGVYVCSFVRTRSDVSYVTRP